MNQMVKLASHRFQGIAGRSNIERRMKKKMKKQKNKLEASPHGNSGVMEWWKDGFEGILSI
jgi:FPC/CPF motif-containing protein YcgG